MTPNNIINAILLNKKRNHDKKLGAGFAPANIALAKYWGKRDELLHLPLSNSLSIALPDKGAYTQIIASTASEDRLRMNGELLSSHHHLHQKIFNFLDYFRPTQQTHFDIDSFINLPISAGLASSSAGYAALVLALNDLFDWQLSSTELSILARLGSGSACRSLWNGFVEWHAGNSANGMDSYGEPLSYTWEDLRIGLLLINKQQKKISSREAMAQTKLTSPYFSSWINYNHKTIEELKLTIANHDFKMFGRLVESNALAMHATALTAWPPIQYSEEKTLATMSAIWEARAQGLDIFFTQDAGPNLKIFFLDQDQETVQALFPNVEIVTPFASEQTKNAVILVDQYDRARGIHEKIAAHQQALCHRAFSVFIFRNISGKLEVLLQQRHPEKIHCGNLWTNTCCSHPQPGENLISAAERRLQEEMGLTVRLFPRGVFHYRADFDNGMAENEVDHVLIGYDEGHLITPNTNEVKNYRWVEISALEKELAAAPATYTPWFKKALHIALRKYYQYEL